MEGKSPSCFCLCTTPPTSPAGDPLAARPTTTCPLLGDPPAARTTASLPTVPPAGFQRVLFPDGVVSPCRSLVYAFTPLQGQALELHYCSSAESIGNPTDDALKTEAPQEKRDSRQNRHSVSVQSLSSMLLIMSPTRKRWWGSRLSNQDSTNPRGWTLKDGDGTWADWIRTGPRFGEGLAPRWVTFMTA